jgi:hypothetical protein
MINKNEKIDFTKIKKGDTDIIATLVTRYFRSIKEVFFTEVFTKKYLEIKKNFENNDEKNHVLAKLLILELPYKVYVLLDTIFNFLYKVI